MKLQLKTNINIITDNINDNSRHYKSIISTTQRGRLSPKQKAIIKSNPNNCCIDLNSIPRLNQLIMPKLFKGTGNLIVDIGFGNGSQLLESAKRKPLDNFIGIELYQKGIANLVNQINQQNIDNIKIINGNAANVLPNFFPDNSIAQIQLFFPDPWPKLRHHKRRLINNTFLEIIKNKLYSSNGILHIATDCDDYAKHILKHMANFPEFNRLNNQDLWRPTTKFEHIGRTLGNKIWDLVFVLQSKLRSV